MMEAKISMVLHCHHVVTDKNYNKVVFYEFFYEFLKKIAVEN